MVYRKILQNRILGIIVFPILFLGFFSSFSNKSGSVHNAPLKIIFEADFASDVEDIGNLAMMNQLAKQGNIKILAVICSTHNPYSVPAISVVNHFFGHSNIPIGILKKEQFTGDSKFRSGYSFNKYLAQKYTHSIKSIKNIPEASKLIRDILEKPENENIIYISSGNLTNLSLLFQSKADSTQSMKGSDLIRKKIKLLIITNGAYPKNDQDYHYITDMDASTLISQNWTGPILYIGHEWDKLYTTGPGLIKLCKGNNPVKESYLLWDKNYYKTFEPFYKGNFIHPHPSRAQIGLYYSLFPEEGAFQMSPIGGNFINQDGANYWIPDNGRKDHYLMPNKKSKFLSHQIELWMSGLSSPIGS